MAKLKVYRTPAGFHDAYVAATSQQAALKAWGSDADLFARGIAEVVTDPKLTEEPLAKPGEIIKRARTAADATPEPRPKRRGATPSKPPAKAATKRAAKPGAPPKPKAKVKAKPKPRPSRARLDAAEQAIADAETRHAAERAALKREEAALTKRRDAMRAEQESEAGRLQTARDKARAAYDRALAAWRG